MSENYIEFSKQIITIPLIQRDYVQGADCNAEKRDAFLNKLFEALLKGEVLELDFIYGSSEKTDDSVNNFIPIDGQQRLTTLTLLGWILNHRVDYKHSEELPKITYLTRPSSEQFCNHLLKYRLPESYESISKYITTVPGWFSERWLSDPTIKAMLEMLDKMDKMLNQYDKDTIDKMADTFFNSSPYTFECLDMHALELDDELYIKMNARGKLLTPFENWKAGFFALLNEKFPNEKYIYNTIPGIESPTLPEYFEYAIEHDWCDLLWPLALSEWKKLSEEDRRKVNYPRIDESFMNFLTYATRFMFFSQREYSNNQEESTLRMLFDKEIDTSISNVLSQKDNVILFFRLLDVLVKLKEAWADDNNCQNLLDNFFDKLFTGKFSISDNRLNIFHKETNLLLSCLKGGEDGLTVSMEVLFWALLKYLLYHPECISNPDESMIDYLRIILGWIRDKHQRLLKGLVVQPNIRLSDYKEADDIIKSLSPSDNPFEALATNDKQSLEDERKKGTYYGKPQFEIIKVLSNCEDLYFCFNLLYKSMSESNDTKSYIKRFVSFYKMSDDERIRALVSHGFMGIRTKTGHYFFGQKTDDNNHWPYIFTATKSDGGFNNAVDAFTSWMNGEPQLALNKKQFGYYLCKYDDFLNAVNWGYPPKHYFVYFDDDWFSAWAVKTFSTRPIAGYNVDPFAFTVAELYKKDSHLYNVGYYSEYSNHGMLYITTNEKSDRWAIEMECCSEGWKIIHVDRSYKCAKNLILRYGDKQEVDEYKDKDGIFSFDGNTLLDLKGKDRIETALAFLKSLE